MVAYPLAPRRAKNKSRRKGDSLRPSAAESPPAKRRPGCRKGWNKTRRFPAQGRRAAAECGAPVRPQKSLAGKMTHPSTPFIFLSAYHKKGGASRAILDRAGAQTGGSYHPAVRLPGRPRGRPAGRPYSHQERPQIAVPALPAVTYHGGVKTTPYKPPQTAYRIADVPAGRRGGMYAARKAFLRQRGFTSRQPVFGCTVGRGRTPPPEFCCPEGSGPWKRPRAACRPPLHPMADPKITHNALPSAKSPRHRAPGSSERSQTTAFRAGRTARGPPYFLSIIFYLLSFRLPSPASPPFFFREIVLY